MIQITKTEVMIFSTRLPILSAKKKVSTFVITAQLKKKALGFLGWAAVLLFLAVAMFLFWVTVLEKRPLMDFVSAALN